MSPILPGERPKLSSRSRLQKDKVTGKPILLYPEGILILNPTAHAIATHCTGETTFEEIVAKLAAQYGASPEDVRTDVTTCLNRFRSLNLLEVLA
jgi:pyrroloquinoline quinone biosynthesis protein D